MNDRIIKNAILFTVNDANEVIENGAVVISQGRISYVGPTQQCPSLPHAEVIDAAGKMALLPGLIDVHSHSSLLRGFSENRQLMDWLPEYQLEHQVLTEEDAYAAALLCYLEALKGGTTCVMDMYRYLHRCGQAAEALGIRINLVPYMATAKGKDFFETKSSTETLIASHHLSRGGKTRVWVGMEHLFYCTPETYTWAAAIAKEHNIGIHTHSSEQQEEVAAVVQHFGKRPIQLFHERGILGPTTVIAHCVWLSDDEIALLADTGTCVAHCPISNAKLASGIARIDKMHTAGICVGLGSDGPISNNNLDLFEEMKFASLMQKTALLNAAALPAADVLRMATIEGAKLIGQDGDIGSIELGKSADLILVDLHKPHLMPTLADAAEGNPVLWNLIYAARGSDVDTVFVEGRCLMRGRKVLTVDEEDVLSLAMSQTRSLLKRRQEVRGHTVAMVAS